MNWKLSYTSTTKGKTGKLRNVCKLNTLNKGIKEEITMEIRKQLEINKNEKMTWKIYGIK